MHRLLARWCCFRTRQDAISWLQSQDPDVARHVQEREAHYLYLGDYERQVASTIKCRVKGDGRVYGMYLKTDSYFEGVGMNELWQAHIKTRYVFLQSGCRVAATILQSGCVVLLTELQRKKRTVLWEVPKTPFVWSCLAAVQAR